MKVYRHIFFKKNILQNGNGEIDVHYYGQMYANCETLKNFHNMYDLLLDLYVACNNCARSKYHSFIKVNK